MIAFISNRCQSWLYKRAQCRQCVEACPIEGCISFKNSQPIVKTEECVGCGICTTVCPTSALVMEGLTDRELWKRLKAVNPLTINPPSTDSLIPPDPPLIKGGGGDFEIFFGCTLGPDTDKKWSVVSGENPSLTTHHSSLVNLPCLAILKESHLISLILSGIQNIYLDLARCSDCSFKHGRKTIEKTVFYASSLLTATGYKDRLKTLDTQHHTPDATSCQSPVTSPNNSSNKRSFLSFRKSKKNNIKTITPGPEYSRRELLHLFRERAVEKAVERVVGNTVPKSSPNPPFEKGGEDIPERRSILLEAFKERTIPPHPQIEDGRFPIHQLKVGEDCTLCHTCNLFCPTGAIKRIEGDGEVRIDFAVSFCMGCYECIELCPECAISKEGPIDLEAVFNGKVNTLFKKVARTCPSCIGTFFPEDGVEECQVCRKKKEQDDRAFDFLFGGLSSLEGVQ